jgi:RNA polymerase subunit RPABC4/transcription elongation factor Spt4
LKRDYILAACPNCGKEVREDFTYCPFCETPLRPSCPSCKREIQADYLMCPYCGFNLSSGTPARLLYRKGGRSTILTLIIALSFFGGVIDIIQGLSESMYDYSLYLYPIPPPELASDLLLVQVALGVLVVILGVAQLFVAYGLVYGKPFSRKYLLKVTSLLFFLFLAVFSCDLVISSMVSLPSAFLSFDIFFVLWSLFLLAIIYRYVRQQEVREILSETAPNPASQDPRDLDTSPT